MLFYRNRNTRNSSTKITTPPISTAELRSCEATILLNALPQLLHKVVLNDGWPPTALLNIHMLSTCCKLSAPATQHLLAHNVKTIALTQLTMNFDRRYALYMQKFYHRLHFTVSGSWNKSLHLQPLQLWKSRQCMRHAASLLYHIHTVASRNEWFTSSGTSGKLTLWMPLVL